MTTEHVSELLTHLDSASPSEGGGPSTPSERPRPQRRAEAEGDSPLLPGIDDAWRPQRPEDRDLLDNFWQHMSAIWGHRWASEWGDVPCGASARTWLAVLRRLSSRSIKQGLALCMRSGERFPPNPGEFFDSVSRPEHRPLPRAHQIEHQAAATEVAQRHLSAMREALGMDTPTPPAGSGERAA